MKAWVVALITWLFSTAILGPLVFFLVLVLAGPHGGLLPAELAPLTLIAGWLIVLGLPPYLAWLAYRSASR